MIKELKKLAWFLIASGTAMSMFVFTFAFVLYDHWKLPWFGQYLLYYFTCGFAIPGIIILIGFVLYLIAFFKEYKAYKKNKNKTE